MTSRKLKFDDSTSSSDTGDVLIRSTSTKVGLREVNGSIPKGTHENKPLPKLANQQIQISVRKLDAFEPILSNDETSNSGSSGDPLLSADLRTNKQTISLKGKRFFHFNISLHIHIHLHIIGQSDLLSLSIICPLVVCVRNCLLVIST